MMRARRYEMTKPRMSGVSGLSWQYSALPDDGPETGFNTPLGAMHHLDSEDLAGGVYLFQGSTGIKQLMTTRDADGNWTHNPDFAPVGADGSPVDASEDY
jgi:hypothetical protein